MTGWWVSAIGIITGHILDMVSDIIKLGNNHEVTIPASVVAHMDHLHNKVTLMVPKVRGYRKKRWESINLSTYGAICRSEMINMLVIVMNSMLIDNNGGILERKMVRMGNEIEKLCKRQFPDVLTHHDMRPALEGSRNIVSSQYNECLTWIFSKTPPITYFSSWVKDPDVQMFLLTGKEKNPRKREAAFSYMEDSQPLSAWIHMKVEDMTDSIKEDPEAEAPYRLGRDAEQWIIDRVPCCRIMQQGVIRLIDELSQYLLHPHPSYWNTRKLPSKSLTFAKALDPVSILLAADIHLESTLRDVRHVAKLLHVMEALAAAVGQKPL